MLSITEDNTVFAIVSNFFYHGTGKKESNVDGLLLCRHFINIEPQLKRNKIVDDDVNNKSSIELRLTELLVIANKR